MFYSKEEVKNECRTSFWFGASTTLTLVCTILLALIYFGQISLGAQMPQMKDLSFYHELGRRFADNHEYVNGTYNCVNYSVDFAFVAQSLGFDVSLTGGWNDSGQGHMWNRACFDYDPQNGVFDSSVQEKYPKIFGDEVYARYTR